MAFWFSGVGAIAGVVSACLWFWAAFGPGVTFDPRQFSAYGGLPEADAIKLQAQIRLNGFAAAAAGVSALLQAIALYLSIRGH